MDPEKAKICSRKAEDSGKQMCNSGPSLKT